MTACSSGHADDVRWLLDAGADPKLVSPEGLTTLDEAASSGSAATVQLLLNAGAKAMTAPPSRMPPGGVTGVSFHLCSKRGHGSMPRRLGGPR